jgi:phage tail sheath protein FI
MAFQVSPGVNVSEIDLTTVVPAVSTTIGGVAGHFLWGPVEQPVLISSEDQLVAQFNKPNGNNYESFFSAANFLAYGNALYVVRANNTSQTNSYTNAANTAATLVVKNADDYDSNHSSGISGVGPYVAKYPGALGNSLKVSVCATAAAYESTLSGTYSITANTKTVTFSANQASTLVAGDLLELGATDSAKRVLRVASVAANGTSATLDEVYIGGTVTANTSLKRRWEYSNVTQRAPGTTAFVANTGGVTDGMHVVIADEDGQWTGTKGQVLEVFENISKASDAKDDTGNTNYYKEVINNRSRYIWWAAHTSGSTNAGSTAQGTTFGGSSTPVTNSFASGADVSSVTAAALNTAYGKFSNKDEYDVSLIVMGPAGQTTVTHVINNVADVRKDCIVCVSPQKNNCVNNSSYEGKEVDDIVTYRNTLPSSNYVVMDGNWKYQYDKYNDVYRWVPCNGDVAGTMVNTDATRDPWFSPAGFQRGRIKNTIKLAFNPRQAERDDLFKNSINPIVTFAGQGSVLFGDKTLVASPSAFDRINVRRLFIVLEKAISVAAQSSLFEINDDFTRAQFRNLVEPFLRDVKGRRGIQDFRVVCDASNNDGQVIDNNQFVCDIYIKPNRSINFVQLNFVAVRTGVEFSEIVGQGGAAANIANQ